SRAPRALGVLARLPHRFGPRHLGPTEPQESDMNGHPLNDAMPPRPLSARWVIRGTLTLKTALHLGGMGDERVDMPVLRDARDGKPLLPGTTLAGALRSALADRLAGYNESE